MANTVNKQPSPLYKTSLLFVYVVFGITWHHIFDSVRQSYCLFAAFITIDLSEIILLQVIFCYHSQFSLLMLISGILVLQVKLD